jgi:acetyl esterase/lipase
MPKLIVQALLLIAFPHFILPKPLVEKNHQSYTVKMMDKKIETLPLYENSVPNSIDAPNKENDTNTDGIMRIAKVSKPTITIYKPENPNGKAVIICPGGGYGILAWEKEGTKVAELFNQWGITAFVLKYRLPDDTTMIDKSLAPLQDAQQAIRMVRKNATKWNINPKSIGIMGFSAGGHLASTAATHFAFNADKNNADTTSVRPDFAILLYPVVSFDQTFTHKGSKFNLLGNNPNQEQTNYFSNELQVNALTPPTFLVHAGDDGSVPVENSIRFYQACIKNKVPVEMHLYPRGGHGFGLNNKTTTDKWTERLENWLNNLK